MAESRTIKIEVEIRKGKAAEWLRVVYPITFNDPASRGPAETLKSIAVCRVDTQFYSSPNFKADGKNWVIRRVFEGE